MMRNSLSPFAKVTEYLLMFSTIFSLDFASACGLPAVFARPSRPFGRPDRIKTQLGDVLLRCWRIRPMLTRPLRMKTCVANAMTAVRMSMIRAGRAYAR